MANENHAGYAKVGLTVVAGVAAIVGTLIYIGGVKDAGTEMLVETSYDKAVSGLSVGSVVNFRGVKVGEVREISFVGNHYKVKGPDNSRIYILMAIDRRLAGLSIREGEDFAANIGKFVDNLGLRATVTASGITGMSRMELDFSGRDGLAPAPTISWTPEHPYIPPKASLFDSFGDSATKVMNQINKMDFALVFSNVSAAVESLAHVADGVKTMVQAQQTDMEEMMDNLSSISETARAFIQELRQNPSLLVRERVPTPLEETAR